MGEAADTVWCELAFACKPGPLDRRPRSIIDFNMPRLDWRLWFVSLSIKSRGLGKIGVDPLSVTPKWFRVLLEKLESREEAVLRLLSSDSHQRTLLEQRPLNTRLAFYEYSFSGGSWDCTGSPE